MRVVVENKNDVRPFVSLNCGDVFQFTDGTPGTWMAVENFLETSGRKTVNAVCLNEYRTMIVRDEREVRVAKSATLSVEI